MRISWISIRSLGYSQLNLEILEKFRKSLGKPHTDEGVKAETSVVVIPCCCKITKSKVWRRSEMSVTHILLLYSQRNASSWEECWPHSLRGNRDTSLSTQTFLAWISGHHKAQTTCINSALSAQSWVGIDMPRPHRLNWLKWYYYCGVLKKFSVWLRPMILQSTPLKPHCKLLWIISCAMSACMLREGATSHISHPDTLRNLVWMCI